MSLGFTCLCTVQMSVDFTGLFRLYHWDLLCLCTVQMSLDFTGPFRLCHWDLLGCALCRCHNSHWTIHIVPLGFTLPMHCAYVIRFHLTVQIVSLGFTWVCTVQMSVNFTGPFILYHWGLLGFALCRCH